jgi:replication factor C subunit 1
MWAQKGDGDSLTYRGLKQRENSIKKDEILRVGLFDAAKTLLEGRRNLSQGDAKAERDSLFRRSDAFFVDYSFTGLLVQQNYPRVMQGQHAIIKRAGDPIAEEQFLNRMHLAAASMSDYAVAEHEIRNGDLNWSLLPACGMLAVQTGYHAGGENGGMLPGFPEFTAWMGKNSSKGKKKRLLSELHHHMNYKVSGSSQDVRESYLPVLRQQLLKHVHSGEEEAAKKAIELMDEYGLSREDVMEKLDEFKMGGGKEPSFADLDSKQKAAFTREYNQGSHKSQALVAEQGAGGKTKKSGGAKRERDPADLDAIDEDDADEESEDEVDDEAELKKLQEKFKKKGRKTKGAAAAKGKKKKK